MKNLKKTFSYSLMSIIVLALFGFWSCMDKHSDNHEISGEKPTEQMAFQQEKQDLILRIKNKMSEAEKDKAVIQERIKSRANMSNEIKVEYEQLLASYNVYLDKLNNKMNEVERASEEELKNVKLGFNTWWDGAELELKEIKIKTKDAFTKDPEPGK